jgi:sigma-B regulation protein RsbU (phosphoserine phosphatase)
MPLRQINRLILFTDGVLEAENPQGVPFFEERLMDVVASHADKPLEDTLDGILSAVLAFSESTQFGDDVCLLGVDVPASVRP